jgi:L-amino acid N-acyltransferase YncA
VASIRRAASTTDFEGVVTLQNRYLKANMSEDERGGGFLSNAFSAEKFQEIDRDCCVLIALDDTDTVVGFLCGSTWDAMKDNALVAAMIANIDMSKLDPATTCIAGPVCLDESTRGQGLMGKLYESLAAFLRESTTMRSMMVFIAEVNAASIKAHTKVGFETIATFNFADSPYLTLIRR